MAQKKRMAGDYEIIHAISAGKTEIVIGENTRAAPDERYLCARCTSDGFYALYNEIMVSDDYAEILQLYGQRIAEDAQRLLDELTASDNKPVEEDAVVPITGSDDLHGKVVVIRADVLKREYKKATHQYQPVTGGFGASANSRGSACYCVNLFTGKSGCYARQDALGIARADRMPQWAKDGLERIEQQRKNKECER